MFLQLDFQRKLLQNVYWKLCIFKDKITEKFKLTEHYLFEEIYNTSDKLNVKIKWTFHFWREFSNCELAQIFTKCVSPPYTSLSSSTKISQNGANWNSSEWHRMKSCSIRTFSVKLHHIVNCNFQSIYIWKKKRCFHLNFVIFWINRIIRTSWKEEYYKVVTRKEKDLFAKW